MKVGHSKNLNCFVKLKQNFIFVIKQEESCEARVSSTVVAERSRSIP